MDPATTSPAATEPEAGTEAEPRRSRSAQAILDAAIALLSEGGVAGVSVDGIAARAGVGKATIYRHWPSKWAVLVDAFACHAPAATPVDTGSVAGDVRALLARVADVIGTSPVAGCIPSLVEAAEHEPELARLHEAFIAERRRPMREVLERGVARGELPAATDVSLTMELLAGPIFHRRLISREPITAAWLHALADHVLANPPLTAAAPAGVRPPKG